MFLVGKTRGSTKKYSGLFREAKQRNSDLQFIAKWINRTRFCSAENLIKPSEKNRIPVLSSLTDPSSYLPVCSGSRTVRHAPFAC
ncbi:hypothetical protein Mal35_20370 [Gimesia maris]|nr:hypothetical protein Mal35_20370 [Gimesia maris]